MPGKNGARAGPAPLDPGSTRKPERKPADVGVGIGVATSEGGAPVPLISSTGSKRSRFSASVFTAVHAKTRFPAGGRSHRGRERPFAARARHRARPRPQSRNGVRWRGRARFAACSPPRACAPPRLGRAGGRAPEEARSCRRRGRIRAACRLAAVQRLVEAPVSREDVDPVCAGEPCHELGGVAAALGAQHLGDVQDARDLFDERLRDLAGPRVDDQDAVHAASVCVPTSAVGVRSASVDSRVAAHAVDQDRANESARRPCPPGRQPRVRPSCGGEDEQRRGALVEVGAKLAVLAAVAEEPRNRSS